ncbi:hypothetical protein PAMA_017284 [Pampus argenteus]
MAKHQILSRSSSEPSQPTYQSAHTPDHTTAVDRCRIDDNTHDQTNTDTQTHDDAQTGHTVNKDKTLSTHDTDVQSLKDKESDETKDTNTEPMEREEKSTDTLSLKRKPGSLFYCVKKKPCLWKKKQLDFGSTAEELHPEKQTNVPETLVSEKTKQDSSSSLDKTGDTLPWVHSLPSTQTVMVSPLSRTEGQWSRPLPPEWSDREANIRKLAGLEKEVQRLRRVLCVEITKTTQGTMTTPDSSTEKQKAQLVTPPASTATRAVGCQTNMAESSTSSSGPAQAQGAPVQSLRTVCGPKEQPEPNRAKKEKNETQSRMRVNDSEACGLEDSRLAQGTLHSIRNNVLVLLTALLPQLDLSGISLETSDIDNILQQIIEVNSLKL